MAKILLVEDNEMNRDLISRRLRRRGYEVLVAVDGAEAVEKAKGERPDLILMDMGLPVLDGYEATRLLKSDPTSRDLPIIGLSAHAMSGDTEKALAAGCDDYDTKPVDWKRLLGKIETLLAKAEERLADLQEARTEIVGQVQPDTPSPDRVLVVDDSAMHRDVLGRRLGELGYTHVAVADGKSALAQLDGVPFDAMLLDVDMPGLGGAELLQQLRAGDAHRDLPVLMLSTIDTAEAAVDCLEHGAADFIPQPFHRRVLSARLEAAIERRRLRREAASATGSGASAEASGEQGASPETVLRALLPAEAVAELRSTSRVLPRRVTSAAVLVVGIDGFAERCDAGEPLAVLGRLHELLGAFEEIAERHGLARVGGEGTSAIWTAGLFDGAPKEVHAASSAALEMRATFSRLCPGWTARFGVHVGPLVAGAVGRRSVRFGIWGSTAETAARICREGAPDGVRLSPAAWQRVGDQASGEPSGSGPRATYRLDQLDG